MGLQRRAPRGAGAGPRGRAPGARARRPASGGRRSATASSSTTTRTPATAPSPRAYSVRPTPDARVSTPLDWDEVPDVEPDDLRFDTVPARLKKRRRPGARHRRAPGSLDAAARARTPRRGGGSRRRALAAPLPQADGRAEAGAAEPRATGADHSAGRRATESSWSNRQSLRVLVVAPAQIFVPWRMRPSETWSKAISTTSSGRSAIHSRSRSGRQREGRPSRARRSRRVRALRRGRASPSALNPDVWPTTRSSPSSS